MSRVSQPPNILRRGRRLMLALQGGGAHGAFTWGVLERLLDEPRFDIRAVSGTSAGALNAAVLAAGWATNGRSGAREALDNLWSAVSRASSGGLPTPVIGLLSGVWQAGGEATARLLEALPQFASPYQFSPVGFNPLRDLLADTVDFDALRRPTAPLLMVCATNVHSGSARLFENQAISAEVLLASACLPAFFQAVEINGEYFWDGGYSLNPPLLALMRCRRARDVLLVQLQSDWRAAVPTETGGIADRAREMAFNAGLLREMETLDALPRWYRRWLPRLHRMGVHGFAELLDEHAPLNTDWASLDALRAAGHSRAETWLRERGTGPEG